jgi:transcription antitermination factor NusG
MISIQSVESFEKDTRIKIRQGVFMDQVGTITRTSKKKVYVSQESLGQVMIVEFPIDHLELI